MRLELEPAYLLAKASSLTKSAVPIIPYIPKHRTAPARRLDTVSAWAGIEDILLDIIERFNLKTDRALEFGVEFGFSSAALSSYFDQVTGVDTFEGDRHTKTIRDFFAETRQRLAPFQNIQLIRSNYQDFVQTDHGFFDLIHVDIIHTFADTYACGMWSAQHSTCTIFHDTESFSAVKQAVREIARDTGKTFYNFKECHGLGILV